MVMSLGMFMRLDSYVPWYVYTIRWLCPLVCLYDYMVLSLGMSIRLDGYVPWYVYTIRWLCPLVCLYD